MNKLIFIFAFACFFLFSTQVKAQDDIPELILEETEGGYIIVNWEDTRVEDEEPQQGGSQGDIPELILEETEGGYVIVNWEETRVEDEAPEESEESVTPVSSGNGSTKSSSSSTKKSGKTVRKSVKVTTRKSYRYLRGNN